MTPLVSFDPLERGLWDILSFNIGRRPLHTEKTIVALVLSRFDT